MNWKQYQDDTAEFFRSLGCDVDVEAKVKGARAEHTLDVWVRFRRFGLETKWVVENKYWNSPVPKEKVLALKSVVEDVGADRGLLLSTAGFQSGAVHASEKTNITLTDLDSFRETAREDLLSTLLYGLETKAIKVKYELHLFLASKKPAGTFGIPKFVYEKGWEHLRAIGGLSALEFGFDQIRLNNPPYPVKWDDSGNQMVFVETLEEFVANANEVIRRAEMTLTALREMQFE
jgi:hypothetical protein